MKRKTFFILAALLLCGSLSAQTNHYTYNYHHFEHKITVVAQINIDGVEQTSSDYEIGAFDGTAVTGSARIGEYGSNHYHRAYFAIFYNTAYDATFKLYNHTTGVELTNCTITDHLGEPLSFVWTDENGYGTNKKPVIFNFLTSSTQTFTKEITGYSNGKGNWYLIASPLGDETNPENVGDMLSNSYDLYYFDQSQELEWRNYKQGEGFNLVSGMGYLYANSRDVNLTFTGTPVEGDSYEVSLVKDDDSDLPGWNLVGNPFTDTAYIDRPFYVMNAIGTEIVAATEPGIASMEGVFVVATEDGENLTFGTTAPSKRSQQIVVNVTRNRGVSIGSTTTAIDRAIVRFGRGKQLPKFQLRTGSTKVYIPMDDKDYALVYSENVGELPINFKAEESGSYTLSFNSMEMSFGYLHLIDNMTGTDTDLLSCPNYTFEAKTADYASRFKLVFVCGSSTSSDAFAFFSNGSFVIINEGEASLQIIDINGRILSSKSINGCTNIDVNATPGVYMLRLVNGDNIKVQKIVVR